MAFYLAIDAGGTKADYLLADDSRLIARVRGGTIKRMRVDELTATANLTAALAELAETSGVSLREIERTCVGTAGNTVPLVTDWLRKALGERVSGELLLTGDVDIALDAAFQGGSGVLVLAGTGSNVAGRAHGQGVMGAGGWGPALADQGSGHRIGSEALRASFLAMDEGRTTTLFPLILEFWQLRDLEALIEFANRIPGPDFSRLTHLVLAAARDGDEVASSVLRREGEDLGYLARLMVRRVIAGSQDSELPALAFAGSIMERVEPVRTALEHTVRQEFAGITILPGVIDPVEGALWRARPQATAGMVRS